MAGEKHSGLLTDLSLISWPWVSNEPFMVPNYGAIFHSRFTLPDDYSHNFSLLRLLILPSPSLLLATRLGLIGLLPSHLPTLVEASLSIHALDHNPLTSSRVSFHQLFLFFYITNCSFSTVHSSHHKNAVIALILKKKMSWTHFSHEISLSLLPLCSKIPPTIHHDTETTGFRVFSDLCVVKSND